MIRKHRPLQVSVQILQIYIFVVFFLRVGAMGKGAEGLAACWRCGAARLPAALSWETRNNVGRAFDPLDICIIGYIHQWDLGDNT